MQQDLGWSYAQAGSLNTANALGYLAGALAMTVAVRAFGHRLLFVCGLVVTAVAVMASAFTAVLSVLLALRALAGASAAAVYIAGAVIAAGLGPRAIGIFFSGAGIGMIVTGGSVPFILEVRGVDAWPHAWMAIGGACVLMGIAGWFAARAMPPTPIAGATLAATTWPRHGCRPQLVAYFLFGAGYIPYVTFIIAWLRDHAAAAGLAQGSALVWCTMGCAVLIGPCLWSPVLGVLPAGRPMALLMGVIAVGVGLPALDVGGTTLLASATVVGLTVFMVPATVTSFVRAGLHERMWGPAMAAFTAWFAAGQALGPVVAGAVADATGSLSVALGVSAGTLVLGALAALLQPAIGGVLMARPR